MCPVYVHDCNLNCRWNSNVTVLRWVQYAQVSSNKYYRRARLSKLIGVINIEKLFSCRLQFWCYCFCKFLYSVKFNKSLDGGWCRGSAEGDSVWQLNFNIPRFGGDQCLCIVWRCVANYCWCPVLVCARVSRLLQAISKGALHCEHFSVRSKISDDWSTKKASQCGYLFFYSLLDICLVIFSKNNLFGWAVWYVICSSYGHGTVLSKALRPILTGWGIRLLQNFYFVFRTELGEPVKLFLSDVNSGELMARTWLWLPPAHKCWRCPDRELVEPQRACDSTSGLRYPSLVCKL